MWPGLGEGSGEARQLLIPPRLRSCLPARTRPPRASSGDGGQSSQVILTCTTVIIILGCLYSRRQCVTDLRPNVPISGSTRFFSKLGSSKSCFHTLHTFSSKQIQYTEPPQTSRPPRGGPGPAEAAAWRVTQVRVNKLRCLSGEIRHGDRDILI